MHQTHFAEQAQPTPAPMRYASAPLEGTKWGKDSIQRVKYSHDAMIDMIIVNPAISQGEIAKAFGYTEPWVSRIFGSDAFQARLAQRKCDLVDPTLVASVEERLRAVASRSLDLVMEKLENPKLCTLDQVMKAVEVSTKALGYGARQTNVAVQTSFVVAMPSVNPNANDWAAQHRGGVVVEGTPAVQIEGEKKFQKVPGIESPELAALVERID